MGRSELFRRIANPMLRLLFHLLYRIDMTGVENVPRRGAFIAMMNHIYFIDPVLVGALTPRYIVIMSKIENYGNPLLYLAMSLYGTFPVHRGELDMTAIRASLKVLQRGDGLLMAPEGTRSCDHQLHEARDGVAWLASRSHVPIVPIALAGQEQLGHCLRRLQRAPLRVAFGQPFCVRGEAEKPNRQQLQRMTKEAMYRLAALLPVEYRGEYSNLQNATSEVLVPFETEKGSAQ